MEGFNLTAVESTRGHNLDQWGHLLGMATASEQTRRRGIDLHEALQEIVVQHEYDGNHMMGKEAVPLQ